jgi:hypothetical protein
MDVLLKILLVACVCYSAVDARPGKRNPYGDSSAQDDLEEELMKCAMSMQFSCAQIVAEVVPEGPATNPGAVAEDLKERGIRDVCRIAVAFEECAMNTLNTQCSAVARQTILMMAGQQITAGRNALRYACVQHIDDFEELEKCVKQKEQQGVSIEAVASSRCPYDPSAMNGGDICRIDDQLTCPIRVLETYCGNKGADAVKGLVTGIFRDLGCDDGFAGRNGIQRAVKLLRRAFK